MNPIQYPTAYKIMHSRLAVNPRNPFESVSTSAGYLSISYRQSGTSMFTFEEYCVMAVGAACVGVALYQLSNIYFASRSLSPTFYEMLEELYSDHRNSLRRLHFPIINMPKVVGYSI